jgi:hypothetical protein
VARLRTPAGRGAQHRGAREPGAQIGTCHPISLCPFESIDRILDDVHVLPAFIFDPAWIAHDTAVPINDYCLSFKDFFLTDHPVSLRTFYAGSYTYHWHNGWTYPLTDRCIAGQLYREICDALARRVDSSQVEYQRES